MTSDSVADRRGTTIYILIFQVFLFIARERECIASVISDAPILSCDLQARLLMGNFIVNKDSVYKTHDELWDGEI